MNSLIKSLEQYHGYRNDKLKDFLVELGDTNRVACAKTWKHKKVSDSVKTMCINPEPKCLPSDSDFIANVRYATFAEYKANKCRPCGNRCEICEHECPYDDDERTSDDRDSVHRRFIMA